jgi:hypothetical protein
VVVPAATTGELVTLESSYNFINVQTYDPPASGPFMPLGLFGFTLVGMPLGGTAEAQMIVPADVSPSSYYKQDPVTGLLTPFDFDGTGGAEINGQMITVHLVDGGEGDADGLADGVIVDPGGPSSISATEGVSWQGIVANITDSDSDGMFGPPETINATVNWGDGSSTTSYSVSVNEGSNANLTASHTWSEKGSYTVTVTATDPDGGTTTTTLTATVADGSLSWSSGTNPPNAPPLWGQPFEAAPSITTPANQTNTEGDSVSLQIHASDTDGDSLSYDALQLPPGLSINAGSGLISGTVAYGAAAEFGGSYSPTVLVADGHGGSASTSFTWTINQVQLGPVLTNPGNQTNIRGDSVSLQLSGTQADGNPLSWSATNLPPGLGIDPDTGLISGTVSTSSTLGSAYAVTVTATDNATSLSASQSFNWTINATNVAPVLTNPGNQTNAAGDYVSLQLSATDADGDGLTYTATGLPSGLALDSITGLISGTLPNSAASGTAYNVTVTASDGLAKSSQNFTWTVNYVSLQNPGNQSNLDGDSVSLQLSAADASGLSLTYSATGLPSGLSIGSTTGLISGTISNTADTGSPYAVTVSASDGSHSASQSFNWTVARLAINNPGNQENREGTTVSLQLSTTDRPGTPTYSATGLPSGLSVNSSTGLISGTLGTATHGSSPYQVTVTATDGSKSSSQSFVWTVTPRVALVNPGNQGNATGDTVSLQLSATSPGGTMSYSATGLPGGLSVNSSTGLISGTIASSAASATPYTITASASDGTSTSSQTFLWTVSKIYLFPLANQNNLDGDTASLSMTSHYHGTGTLSYSAGGLPSGLSINSSTGLISGAIAATADGSSPYSVTVTDSDSTNSTSQSFTWTVGPRIYMNSINSQSNGVGDAVSLQVPATDANNATLSYSASGLPSGLTINSSTGVVSGTIAVGADSGSPYTVTVTANDGTVSVSQSFTWTVTHVSLTNPGPQQSRDSQAVSLQIQGRDADGDSLTWTATGLPSGLSIGGSNGLIAGTLASNADASSPYVVSVTARDASHTVTQTFLWTVSQVSLTAPSAQTNSEGDTVSLQLQGATSTGSLTYSVSVLPAGLSLNGATGLISGTIAAGAAVTSPYTVDVAAANGNVSTSQSFTWTVNPVVNLTAPVDQSNNEGNTVSLQVTATDTLGRTLTYSATGLPSGLTINSSTGLISGSIAAGDSSSSPYFVAVTASDGTYSSSAAFGWTVTHTDTTALTMTNLGTQTNVAGDSPNLPIQASDPDGTDTLTYSATGLPDGLSIDPLAGIISGTVADDAISTTPYSVTVTASDGNGQSVSQTFTWIINVPPLTPQAATISAVEGNDTGSITVATFTTPDFNSTGGDFTASVNWGDGSRDTGTVTGSNGSFTVSDNHIYAEKGSYTVTVQINNTITGASATVASSASAADAALHLTGGFQLGDPVTDAPASFTVAYFIDDNPNAPTTDYLATINWGDPSGSTTGILTSAGGGYYLISGLHNYGNPYPIVGPLTYTVTVTLTDVDGASASTTSTVVLGALSAQVPASTNAWLFQDQNPSATINDFVANGQTKVALINWGDGSTSLGAVGGTPTNFAVTGTHTYALDSLDQPNGQYQMTVTPTDVDGSTLTGTEPVSVVRPPVLAWANNLVAQPGVALSNVQAAAFTVPDANDSTSEFTATINWGDGNSSSGTIQQVTGGLFQVLGSHSYATAGYYTLLVTISQGWLAQKLCAVAAGEVRVGNLPDIMLYSLDFSGKEGIILQADDKDTYNSVDRFGQYSPDQWLDKNLNGKIDPGDHQYPYAIVSGSGLNVSAVFKPQKRFMPPADIWVRGWVHAAEPGGVFRGSFAPVMLDSTANQSGGTQFTYTPTVPLQLPHITEGMPTFQIDWEYSVNGEKTWMPAGMSVNHLYLTFKPMTNVVSQDHVTKKLQTVFAYAASDSQAFDDARDPQFLVNYIWNNFSNRKARRALDNKPLTYYKDWNTPCRKYYDLVSTRDGGCLTWAELLAASLLADGLNTVPGDLSIRWDAIVPIQRLNATGFFVKNWKFAHPGEGQDNINYYLKTETHSYKWAPGTTVEANKPPNGIAGQNEPNPASIFQGHAVIEIDTTGKNILSYPFTLYDPSYGVIYGSFSNQDDALKKLQDNAIEALYQESPGAPVAPQATKYTINPITKDTELVITANRSTPF